MADDAASADPSQTSEPNGASEPDQAFEPRLAYERIGAGPRLVLVHGFTQNRHCWGLVADDLEQSHELVLVDAPGHGDSRAAAVADISFVVGAGLIGEAGGRGTYLGYSMGGRYCLRLALDRPELVERLVLIGTSPGLESESERVARVQADEARAVELERTGVAAFVDEWLALPLFAGLTPEVQFRAERLANDPSGLASSLRRAGTGAQEPLWRHLDRLTMPVLLVAGRDDPKFVAIAERMAREIGANAERVTIPAAGHTAHLEQPEAFLDALHAWLP